MEQVKVDWHIHTTLSPCASLSMDPLTIFGQAKSKNIQVIGITDHNSTRQARMIKTGFCSGNLLVLAGAEVTTREEIHCLAFFDELEALDAFQNFLDLHLPWITNNPEYFGDQVVVDSNGNIVYEEERLLISALDQSLEQVERFVTDHCGIFIPAHINRPYHGLLSQLGMIPASLRADALEWLPDCRCGLEYKSVGKAGAFPLVYSSDAHRPEEIGVRFTELNLEEKSFAGIRQGLLKLRISRQ